jgi:hypothetical protein
MIWFERKTANSFSFHWKTGGWHSGKTGALEKLALWQNLRSDKTCALAKLALWQNWRSGKLALWQN